MPSFTSGKHVARCTRRLSAGRPFTLGMLAILLTLSVLAAQTVPDEISVSARRSTSAVSGDADDPAIWIHPEDPALSLIIGTDKIGNFIYVWDVNGIELQRIPLSRTPNNGDVRTGILLGGVPVDIYAVGVDAPSRIVVFKIDPASRTLSDITTPGGIATPEIKEPYGFALYRRQHDGTLFAFMNSNGGSEGVLQQYRLFDDGTGRVAGVHVRALGGDVNGQHSEGIVADDELGYVYISEEDCCIHKFYADPDMGNQQLAEFAHTDGIEPDREGLGIYACQDGGGYLLLSSQGNRRVKVYRREGDPGNPHSHTLVTTIYTADATSTDGLDVTSRPAGSIFPHGLLAKHHSSGKNFRLYAWEEIAQNYLTVCSISAAFTASTTSGCAPLTVNFTDQSSGPVTAWQWDFGDGSTASEQHPVHTYSTGGNYTVTLTTSNAYGYRQTSSRQIAVGAAPTAAFTAAPLSGNAPLTVTFTDQSRGEVREWLWDFGDSTTSTQQHPTHEYAKAGIYSVTLTVSDSCGSHSETKTELITVNSPVVADFAADDSSGCPPLTVQFTDLSSGNATSWWWDFGDGSTSSEQNPSHTYSVAGLYTVTLKASSAAGSDEEIKTAFIRVKNAPQAAFAVDKTVASVGKAVTFTESASNEPTSWWWDFGDGVTTTERNPRHAFATAGEYTVSLTVANECSTHTESRPNFITVVDTVSAAFSAADTPGCAPHTVAFTDLSTGPVTVWRWDFGDGTASQQQNPSHTYTSSGRYAVTLTVYNAANDSSVFIKPALVQVDSTPLAAFQADVTTGNAPLQVHFVDQSTGNPSFWSWDFGDGNQSTEQNPRHTYAVAGDYTVTLITGNACSSDTLTQTSYIHVEPCLPPQAAFSVSDTVGTVPLQVHFTDHSSGAPTAWRWDFGDGATAREQNPSHRYLSAGKYSVTLTASNDCDSSTIIRQDYVTVVDSVTAAFSADSTTGCIPLAVQFHDRSSGPVTSWLWEFGDGATSTEQNPRHSYASAGRFTVKLTVHNAAGYRSVAVKGDFIDVMAAPVAAFSAAPTAGNAPLQVTFTDLSTGKGESWSWDFGDGNTSTAQHPIHTYAAPGDYTVRLLTSNACGESETIKTALIHVEACAPITAAFSAEPLVGQVPLVVQFSDSSTGDPTSWLWDFGDGNSVTTQHPTHQYSSPGTYTVTLTASNACTSATEVKTGYITVNAQPTGNLALGKSVIASSAVSPYNAEQAVDGDGTSYWRSINTSKSTPNTWLRVDLGSKYPLDRAVVKWKESYFARRYRFEISNSGGEADSEWTTVYTNSAGTAGTQDVTFTSPFAARYFRIRMDQNNKDNNQIFELECYASSPCLPPTVNFSASPITGPAPLSVAFRDLSSGNPHTWSWDFGDGATATEQHPTHIYQTPGEYSVSLTASNDCGSSTGSKAYLILVTACQPPQAGFSATPTSGNAPLTVRFTDQSLGNVTAWQWDLGDGTSSTEQHPVHTYADSGSYTVQLMVNNACGADTIKQENLIRVSPCMPPVASFTATPTSGNAPLTVNFSDQSTGNPNDWWWHFGDDSTATQQNPSHTYAVAGDYTVKLRIRNPCGTDSLTRENYIHVNPCLPPTANFSATPTSGNAPLTVNFADESSGNPTSWSWDFGDGTSSSEQNPSHQYTLAGTYTVKLTVNNSCDFDSETKIDYITVNSVPTGNLARGKLATASSTTSPYGADRAVDGSATSYWRSGAANKSSPNIWLRVDLETPYTLRRAVVKWKESYYARRYRFEISNSGGETDSEWTTVYTNTAGTAGTQDVSFTAPFAARYFRIRMEQNNKDNNQIFELECYASTAKQSARDFPSAVLPEHFELKQNYPNPFNPSTTITFDLATRSEVGLAVYNTAGQLVKELASGTFGRGRHQIIWDATDSRGVRVTSGVYIVVLQTDGFVAKRKLVLAK